jgi:hypothetical protein
MRSATVFVMVLLAGLVLSTSEARAQYSCRTEFRNNVQGAVITNIATQYYYRPSGTSFDSQRTLMGYHENGYTNSRDDVSCVSKGSHAVVVEYGGQSQAYTSETPDAGTDLCWQVMPVQELNPHSRVKMGLDKKKPRIEDLVDIYSIDPETGTRTKLKVKWFDNLNEATAYLKKQVEEKK